MTKIQRKSDTNKKFLLTKFLVFSFFAIALLLQPKEAHAAEAVFSVLRDTTTGTGQIILNIWKDLLAAINSLVIIVLIVVAFAEMLRININTYGLKKILPTLLFAIIAANFSFLFCRIIVDVANVSMTFLSNISGQGLKPAEIHLPEFKWNASPWYSQVFPLTVLNLSLLVEAIILLCLAFLLLARNWVLYVLVIFSSVGIMALVLPQTKKYFNMWWENLIKWTFMPLVSYLFIALANRFSGSFMGSADTSAYVSTFGGIGQALMGAVFAGVCYYFAITMPFKLGGAIMDNFYKMTGAKHFVGKTKELAGMKISNAGNYVWGKYLQAGLDLERGQSALGRTGFGKFIGRNWIGNALNKAKADQKQIEENIAGVVEGVQARHQYRQGEKLVLQRAYNRNRQGEIKEYGLYATEDLIKKGLQAEAEGKKYDPFEKLRAWRAGSAVAKTRMSTAEEAENNLISQGVKAFMKTPDFLKGKEREDLLASFGYTEDEYNQFKNYYQRIVSKKETSEMEEKKSLNDPKKDAMNEIAAAHNVVEFHELASEWQRLMKKHGTNFQTFISGTSDEIQAMMDGMSGAAKKAFNDDMAAMEKAKRDRELLKKIAIDMKSITREQASQLAEGGPEADAIRERMTNFAVENYKNKLDQIKKMVDKNGNKIPLHMMEVVSRDEKGNIQLKSMERFAASRVKVWIDRDTSEGASEWVTQYGIPAMSEAMINGLPYESVEGQDVLAVHLNKVLAGRTEKNARKATQVYESVVRSMISGNPSQRLDATEGYLGFLNHHQTTGTDETKAAMKEEVKQIVTRLQAQFNSSDMRERLEQLGGNDGVALNEIMQKGPENLDDSDYTNLFGHLTNTVKSSSSKSGGTGVSNLITTALLGERARIGEKRV